ncbi:hypothetical protein ACLOJK_024263 [Asimina triloba]
MADDDPDGQHGYDADVMCHDRRLSICCPRRCSRSTSPDLLDGVSNRVRVVVYRVAVADLAIARFLDRKRGKRGWMSTLLKKTSDFMAAITFSVGFEEDGGIDDGSGTEMLLPSFCLDRIGRSDTCRRWVGRQPWEDDRASKSVLR